MAKYAATTEVSEEKSRMEIETILRRYGANAFSYGWEEHKAIFSHKDREVKGKVFHIRARSNGKLTIRVEEY